MIPTRKSPDSPPRRSPGSRDCVQRSHPERQPPHPPSRRSRRCPHNQAGLRTGEPETGLDTGPQTGSGLVRDDDDANAHADLYLPARRKYQRQKASRGGRSCQSRIASSQAAKQAARRPASKGVPVRRRRRQDLRASSLPSSQAPATPCGEPARPTAVVPRKRPGRTREPTPAGNGAPPGTPDCATATAWRGRSTPHRSRCRGARHRQQPQKRLAPGAAGAAGQSPHLPDRPRTSHPADRHR